MTQRNFFKYLTRVHKWAGLVIGLQIMIWFVTGTFFTIFPIEQVRGYHLVDRSAQVIPNSDIIAIDTVARSYSGELTSIKMIGVDTAPIYVMEGSEGRVMMDARDGVKYTGPNKAEAANILERVYLGDGILTDVVFIKTDPPLEYRDAPLPVWQGTFDDKANTRIYIHGETGDVVRTRTKLWRVFDFMWMLHIMDYDDRSDIDNWWLTFVGICAALFGLTGIGLLFHRFKPRPKPPKT